MLDYDWDEDEQLILYDMGRQFNLSMTCIARRTTSNEINTFLEEEVYVTFFFFLLVSNQIRGKKKKQILYRRIILKHVFLFF